MLSLLKEAKPNGVLPNLASIQSFQKCSWDQLGLWHAQRMLRKKIYQLIALTACCRLVTRGLLDRIAVFNFNIHSASSSNLTNDLSEAV